MKASPGQSLIETIAAIFVLTTGLVSGLALATFSFSAASEVTDKIAATGLAREGIEIVRRMRDSNWLQGGLTDCSLDLGSGQACYPSWLDQTYNIQGSASGLSYRVEFDPTETTNSKWSLGTAADSCGYRIYTDSNVGLSHNCGLGSTQTKFFRKIELIDNSTASPYSATSPRMLVRSKVWWYGKRCNNTLTDLTNPSQTTCKIITEEYLTNWKNY